MAAQGSIRLTPQQLPGFLQKLAHDLTSIDQRSFFKQVGIALENGAKDSFNSSKSPANQPWSPLRHPRPRGGNKPLLDRGLLRASLTNNGQGHIERQVGDSLEWGTNMVQAALHQYGGVITPKHGKFLAIPASVEAVRAGGPGKFPDAKRRLKWAINKKGTGGIVYEYTGKKKKKTKGKGRKRGGGVVLKSISRSLKRVKRFSKRVRRLGGKMSRALKKSAVRIERLTKKIISIQKRLRSGGLGFRTMSNLSKLLSKTKRTLSDAKSQHLKIKREKNAKEKRGGKNEVRFGNKLVHYFLTKRVEVPARPFVGISKNTEEVILDIAEDHIIRGVP